MRLAWLVIPLLGFAEACYASHGRGGADAAGRCTFSFRSADGDRVECVVTHEDAACDDAARCVCVERLGGAPSEAALEACLVAERTPRALITFSDFCVSELDMQEALDGYFRLEGGASIAPTCAEIPARFGP